MLLTLVVLFLSAVGVFILPLLIKKIYALLLVYILLQCAIIGSVWYGCWKHDYDNEQRLAELGFVWNYGTEDDPFANVAPENMEEATSLYNSHMGVGWPAQVIVVCIPLVFFSTIIYWLMGLGHWIVIKMRKNTTPPFVASSSPN